ncbi:MAG: alpha/beta hydrolase [Proteobacteria bacterium]|nr:alpha/beta hydrolase [Pseudomonadota bacterium]
MHEFSRKIKGLDSVLHAYQGRFFMNMSPTAIFLAYADWACHFINSPEKQVETLDSLINGLVKLSRDIYAGQETKGQNGTDPRFSSYGWQRFPFSVTYKTYLAAEYFLNHIMSNVNGVTPHHEEMVCFITRQMLQAMAPSNVIMTNPDILELTLGTRGQNLVQGSMNFIDDCSRLAQGKKPAGTETFQPGVNVAVTPGTVVFKNRLIELIRYAPSTDIVYAEPVLIVPAWIMKYYILDLSEHNSLVRFLVDQGHTVFMISWKNPGAEERDLGMVDYLKLGVIEAVNAVSAMIPGQQIHSVGYCLGGTLLAIAVAYLEGRGDACMKTMTLLAAQTDFTDAGELTLFIDDSQVAWLEDLMNSQNYLKTDQMAGAFRLLRANELIWADIINTYLRGERTPVSDLMAWNADATRMPYTMHSEYLRSLFLQNDLFEGRYRVEGVPVALSNIHVPVFLVATRKDHVAPWLSVYKFYLPSDAASVTFVLTSGGHNAGIISEPGHPGRSYQIACRKEGETYMDPKTFEETTPVNKGSWWIPWQMWLAEHSGAKILPPGYQTDPQKMIPAPGEYVLEK